MFYSNIGGLPKGVKWPVRLLTSLKSPEATVFCKSDNKSFSVSTDQLVPFPNDDFEKKGLAALKRKPSTKECFIKDVKWARKTTCSRIAGDIAENSENCDQDKIRNLPLAHERTSLNSHKVSTAKSSVHEYKESDSLFESESTDIQSSETEYKPSSESESTFLSDDAVKLPKVGNCIIELKGQNDDQCSHISDTTSGRSEIIPLQGLITAASFSEKKNIDNVVVNDDDDDDDDDDDPFFEESILRALDQPDIYIRKVLKSETSKDGSKKKDNRVYNSHQHCFLCKKMVTNFTQHIQRRHQDVEEVRRIFLENVANKRRDMLLLLRAKYNNHNNVLTVREKKGELILERRPATKFCVDDYGPCPGCFLWIAKNLLYKHQKLCKGSRSLQVLSTSNLVSQSDAISGRVPMIASSMLNVEVFAKMNFDEVGKICRTDDLIIQLGNQELQQNISNVMKRGNYASQGMRLVARFLINLRAVTCPSLSLWDFLKPMYYSAMVRATEMMDTPSNSVKLTAYLQKVIHGKIGLTILQMSESTCNQQNQRQKLQEDRQNAEDLLTLLKVYWSKEVSRPARATLSERNFTKINPLPQPHDLKKLNDFLTFTLKNLNYENHDAANFRLIAETLEAKLNIYNRRRPGEIESLKLSDFERRMHGTSASMMELTTFEQKLLESQEVVTVRGKRDRGVPIIFPIETLKGMSYLTNIEIRRFSGVDEDNQYVFAGQGMRVLRAYDSLKSACEKAELKHPNLITSTNLRKYMATIIQVLDLKDNELDWIIRHLGHTLDVHKIHYRATSDVLEKTQISKLLLLQDTNQFQKFSGKKLEDIQFEDIVLPSDSLEVKDIATDSCSRVAQPSEELLKITTNSDENDRIHAPSDKKTKTGQKSKWSLEEEKEIRVLFRTNFEKKVRPTPDDCLKAISKSKKNNGFIQFRKKDVLKKKLFRLIDKLK